MKTIRMPLKLTNTATAPFFLPTKPPSPPTACLSTLISVSSQWDFSSSTSVTAQSWNRIRNFTSDVGHWCVGGEEKKLQGLHACLAQETASSPMNPIQLEVNWKGFPCVIYRLISSSEEELTYQWVSARADFNTCMALLLGASCSPMTKRSNLRSFPAISAKSLSEPWTPWTAISVCFNRTSATDSLLELTFPFMFHVMMQTQSAEATENSHSLWA